MASSSEWAMPCWGAPAGVHPPRSPTAISLTNQLDGSAIVIAPQGLRLLKWRAASGRPLQCLAAMPLLPWSDERHWRLVEASSGRAVWRWQGYLSTQGRKDDWLETQLVCVVQFTATRLRRRLRVTNLDPDRALSLPCCEATPEGEASGSTRRGGIWGTAASEGGWKRRHETNPCKQGTASPTLRAAMFSGLAVLPCTISTVCAAHAPAVLQGAVGMEWTTRSEREAGPATMDSLLAPLAPAFGVHEVTVPPCSSWVLSTEHTTSLGSATGLCKL